MSHTATKKQTHPTLRAWRASEGLNQIEAAQRLKISYTTYQRLERGAYSMRVPMAKRLAPITGVPVEILAGVA